MKGLLLRWETPTGSWRGLAGLVAMTIFLRGILEGVMESDHLLGVRAVPGVSQAMLFIHFPAFYVAAFLLLILIVHGWSGRTVGAVATTISKVWPVTLLPPVLDAIVSGGRGYDLGYLGTAADIGTVLRGFFAPTLRQLPGVTPGMRAEILAACVGILVYVGTWRGAVRGLTAAATAFAGLLALGSAPALGGVGREGWMDSGGFGNLQSHRLGIVYLSLSLLLCCVVWSRADGRSLAAWFRGFRWLRSIVYAGLAGLGVWIALVLQRPWMDKAFTLPGDWLSLLGLLLAEVACFQSAAVANDLADAPWDDAGPKRRMLREGMDPRVGRTLWPVLAVTGLALALCVQYAVFLILLTQLALAALYSWEPLRLKRLPVLSTGVVATAAVLAVAAGGAVLAREWVFRVVPGRLLGSLWLSFFLGFGVKDIADEAADRRAGVMSLPVMLGRKATPVLAGGSLCAFAAFPFLAGMSTLRVVGIVLGVACAVAVAVGRRWSEPIALFALLAGVAGVAAGTAVDDDWADRSRRLIPELCGPRAPRHPEDAVRTLSGWCPGGDASAALKAAWPLAGSYPWLMPEVARDLEPIQAVGLLRAAAASGVCTGLAAAAMLEPLVRLGHAPEWRHAFQGALAGGREDGSLLAIGARQADELGMSEVADALRMRGVRRWPASAEVWAELAREKLAGGTPREALDAIVRAQALDPGSPELKRDVEYVRAVWMEWSRERGENPR
ncbi:MAG: UbiA family prenyltransferase [Candidatus Eisenbacteria bacterium]|jgi:4-hydroxybenzoate polyprenyltransferase|nr:UbiA family prenyltransferase [Candidatus Eisenbacteria bacterium]